MRQILSAFEPSPTLAPALRTTGFIEALLALIASCKAAGVSPGDLEAFGRAQDHPTLGELATLYAAYEERLLAAEGEIPFSDADDRLRDATLGLEEGAPLPALLSPETTPFVIVQDRLDLTVAEGRLLQALGERLGALGQGLISMVPNLSARPELMEDWDDRIRAALPGAGARAVDLLSYELTGGSGALGPLVARLFCPPEGRDTPDPAEGDPGEAQGEGDDWAPPEDTLLALEGPSLAAEIRGVVGEIRRRLLAGAAPEAIAVAAPSWGRYTVPFQRALDASGIRWSGPSDPPLGVSPVARVALELCHLVRRGFPRDALLALFGGGEEGQLVTPQSLLGERFRDGSQAALLLRRSGAQRQPRPGEEGDAYRTYLVALSSHLAAQGQASDAEEALALADACDALFLRLAPLGETAPLSVTARRLRAILGELGLLPLAEDWRALTRFRNDGGEGDALAQEELRILARDQAAAREMLGLIDGLARTGRLLGDPTLEPGAFVQLLGEAISDDRLPVRGARGGQVILLPLSMLGGRSFEHVFILGLNEGDLPRVQPPDPLLSDSLKSRYNESEHPGAFFDTTLARQRREAGQLLMGVAAAEASLTLSWSRQDDTGRERLPSPWIDDVLRAAPGLKVRMLPGSPIPPISACHTLRDLERRVGLSALSPDVPPGEAQAMAPVLETLKARSPARWGGIEALADIEAGRLAFFLGLRPGGGAFVGQLSPGRTLDLLKASLPGGEGRPLSPKQLEEFSTCGFKYFAGRVLKVGAIETQGEDLDLRQAGNLLHSILQHLYQGLAREGLLPLLPEGLAAAMGQIAPALEAVGVHWRRTQPHTHSGLFELRRERMIGQLRALLRFEAESNAQAAPEARPTPTYFERPFGMKVKDPMKEGADAPEAPQAPPSLPALAIPSGDGTRRVYLRGIIDRIDRVDGGYRVIDYKSGGTSAQEAKLKGDRMLRTDLQLPLYALAVREGMGGEVDALFYGLKKAASPATKGLREVFHPSRGKPWIPGTYEDFLALDPVRRAQLAAEEHPNVANRVWAIIEGMEAGAFLVQPETCKFCDFKGVCRVMNLIDAIEEGGDG